MSTGYAEKHLRNLYNKFWKLWLFVKNFMLGHGLEVSEPKHLGSLCSDSALLLEFWSLFVV